MIYARRDIASKTTKGPLLPIAGDQRIVDYRYIDDRVFMPKRKLIPLPSAAFQILLALAAEDLHGCCIRRQVVEQPHGRMRWRPGTRYSSIQTLGAAKLMEEIEPR